MDKLVRLYQVQINFGGEGRTSLEGQSGGEKNTNFNPGNATWRLSKCTKEGIHKQLKLPENFSIKIPVKNI